MGIFTPEGESAESRTAEDQTIADFWAWWTSEGRASTVAVFDADTADEESLEAIADTVGGYAEDLDLGFETGPGETARFVLVFTPAGDPETFDVADRWLAAAPAADADFEYDNRRRAVVSPEDVGIEFGEESFDMIDAVVVTEESGDRLDLHVWHPAFAEAPQEVAGNVTFLLLDALLGERVVEDRIGEVRFDTELGVEAVELLELRGILGLA